MPRKNHTPRQPRVDPTPEAAPRPKRRYPTRAAAEQVAELQMLATPGLELHVYQGPDRGWYLTRRRAGADQ